MFKSVFNVNLLFIALVLLFHTSCEYDGGDDNFHTVTPPVEDSIAVEVIMTGLDLKDTIDIYEGISIPYEITFSSGRIVTSTFKVDTIPMEIDDNFILIDTALTLNRVYPLRLDLWISPQTGSLADINGREGVNFKDSTVLYLKFVNPE